MCKDDLIYPRFGIQLFWGEYFLYKLEFIYDPLRKIPFAVGNNYITKQEGYIT